MIPPLERVMRFAARIESLDLAHKMLAEFLAEGNVPPAVGKHVALAMSEGVTNAVRHSRGDMVTLKCSLDRNVLTLAVIDDGKGFDIEEIPPPDLDVPREGGYGLYIMRKVMDSVTYECREGGNILTLVKFLDRVDGGNHAP